MPPSKGTSSSPDPLMMRIGNGNALELITAAEISESSASAVLSQQQFQKVEGR